MEKEFKSGFISLVGRTNVGKSTLLNNLVKEKVAITANKSQTTRTAIKAIITNENSQIIVTDTPGIHKPKTKLGETMVDTAFTMLGEVDAILYVIDANERTIGKGDTIILEKIKSSKKPCILIINKIDLINKETLLNVIDMYKNQYDFSAVIPISALKDNTDTIIKEIEKLLPVGPKYYDEEEYTDQTSRQLVEEKIREKALKFLNDEVPHGIFVEVDKFSQRQTTKGDDIIDVDATIYCLREGHKGIIIGKAGAKLKQISSSARRELEDMFGMKVNLKVWVKVKKDWQENDSIVNNKFKLK